MRPGRASPMDPSRASMSAVSPDACNSCSPSDKEAGKVLVATSSTSIRVPWYKSDVRRDPCTTSPVSGSIGTSTSEEWRASLPYPSQTLEAAEVASKSRQAPQILYEATSYLRSGASTPLMYATSSVPPSLYRMFSTARTSSRPISPIWALHSLVPSTDVDWSERDGRRIFSPRGAILVPVWRRWSDNALRTTEVPPTLPLEVDLLVPIEATSTADSQADRSGSISRGFIIVSHKKIRARAR
mmetsp:Transcript_27719/g.56077  ORF Transcript_27719/g.56077 Transcript_27719/m.56077 type:complete len:242 (-) Transcript_27719:2683-3408(-)